MFSKISKIVAIFIFSIFKMAINIYDAIKYIWENIHDGSVLFAIFYQPILVASNLTLLSSLIYDSLKYNEMRAFNIFIIASLFLILAFIENTVIELCYHLRGKTEDYEKLQKLQQYFNNYTLTVISLIALFAGAFLANSETVNLVLLVFGVLCFISTICSDAYRIFISETEKIKILSVDIREMWKNN